MSPWSARCSSKLAHLNFAPPAIATARAAYRSLDSFFPGWRYPQGERDTLRFSKAQRLSSRRKNSLESSNRKGILIPVWDVFVLFALGSLTTGITLSPPQAIWLQRCDNNIDSRYGVPKVNYLSCLLLWFYFYNYISL